MARNLGRDNDKVTPAAKQEPTNAIYKQGGFMTPDAAIANDKSSVRAPVTVDQVKK